MFLTGLGCTVCQGEYRPEPSRYVCDRCGEVGTLDARYDYPAISRVVDPDTLATNPDNSMWRYLPLIPVEEGTRVSSLVVGGTPLIRSDRLASDFGVRELWVKDEGRQPTASLKDRASAVALARAAMEKAPVITTASTGNAAAALAGLASGTGQSAVIFVPESAPEAKVAQLLAYGATVCLVEGNYDSAVRLCQEAVARFGWYNRNTGINPYVGEGKKTVALEILEQLGWSAPDAIFVSVGDGSIIGGVHKGLKDALTLGWIDRMPRIFGVQSSGSAFLAQAWSDQEDVVTKKSIAAQTRADSISADLPRDRVKAMAAVTETGGEWIVVTDDRILEMIPYVSARTGVFPEPAAAAAFAGLAKAAAGFSGMDGLGRVVVISTGSGLKDIKSVMAGLDRSGAEALHIKPGPTALDGLELSK
ncbi:MAG: threonine synthase [Acidimicrobiia bacterium]|nr:threonine synthase [bacterium]MXX63904.1 threonine synthase [Acidimicrobiia bacterium]MXZ06162.1 threonine synthase [Acidimicrobiia bacterium]MYD03926.1 threonine synthase [Acidimicrobiia bacterium]MYF26322.1 threonine synthase [Acidimicrobiia bacterium]